MTSRLLINIAGQLTGWALLFLFCYLRGPGFPPDKSISPHNDVVTRLAAHLKLQPDLWTEYASWLLSNKVIFPSVEVIERTLAEATTLADRAVFSALTAQLEPGQKAALDRLLLSEGEQPSRLAWLAATPCCRATRETVIPGSKLC